MRRGTFAHVAASNRSPSASVARLRLHSLGDRTAHRSAHTVLIGPAGFLLYLSHRQRASCDKPGKLLISGARDGDLAGRKAAWKKELTNSICVL